MLSKELEETLNQAFENAREKKHEFMTVEHLLLALLDNSSAARVLIACGGEIKILNDDEIIATVSDPEAILHNF